MRVEVKDTLEVKQKEKEELIQKVARGKQVLANNQFTDQDSITAYSIKTQGTFDEYTEAKEVCGKKSKKILSVLSLVIATLLLCGAGAVYYLGDSNYLTAYGMDSLVCIAAAVGAAIIFYLIGLILYLRLRHRQKDMELSAKVLQEIFSRHLGDTAISMDAMRAFQARMAEFTRLSSAIAKSETAIEQKAAEITELQGRQETCRGSH